MEPTGRRACTTGRDRRAELIEHALADFENGRVRCDRYRRLRKLRDIADGLRRTLCTIDVRDGTRDAVHMLGKTRRGGAARRLPLAANAAS
jgi:hypothetical protein